jgi:hypothetical protein
MRRGSVRRASLTAMDCALPRELMLPDLTMGKVLAVMVCSRCSLCGVCASARSCSFVACWWWRVLRVLVCERDVVLAACAPHSLHRPAGCLSSTLHVFKVATEQVESPLGLTLRILSEHAGSSESICSGVEI